MRPLVLLALAAVLAAGIGSAEGAGECARAIARVPQLARCAPAGRNPQSAPTAICCVAVRKVSMASPDCVCAVFLNDAFKLLGVKPEVALTIPKRCGIADCGDNTFP